MIEYLNTHFVSISVNADIKKPLVEKWKIRGLPLIWFLESDSSKISNVAGYVDKKRLLSMLTYIHTNADEKLSFRQFLEEQ
ncbi:MAG: hypothetical protein MI862_10470 [Desulfobacterales bacterium]|nr:hypothetical protein [Desulfobacterales bacterium]